MYRHYLRIYLHIVAAARRTFGLGRVFRRWLLIPPFVFVLTRVCLWLDNLLFPGYKKVQVRNPVFIIGHPRSGTTFLHKLLTHSDTAVTFKAWHLFSPAITSRVLLRPFYWLQLRRRRAVLAPKRLGHEVSLDKVEEEEFLFVHNLDTQFLLTRSPLAFDDQEYPELRRYDEQPAKHRLKSARIFKSLLQRQIYLTGKTQVIAQMHFSTYRIKTLMEVFPDAKFIYLVRSPLEAIPSHLSLVWNSLDLQWGCDRIPPELLERFVERRYRYNVELYRYFHRLMTNGELPEDRVMVLKYDDLVADPKTACERVITFTGVEADERLRQGLIERSRQQRAYVRAHRVAPIESFGLTEERIVHDLHFVFDEFGFAKPHAARAA